MSEKTIWSVLQESMPTVSRKYNICQREKVRQVPISHAGTSFRVQSNRIFVHTFFLWATEISLMKPFIIRIIHICTNLLIQMTFFPETVFCKYLSRNSPRLSGLLTFPSSELKRKIKSHIFTRVNSGTVAFDSSPCQVMIVVSKLKCSSTFQLENSKFLDAMSLREWFGRSAIEWHQDPQISCVWIYACLVT